MLFFKASLSSGTNVKVSQVTAYLEVLELSLQVTVE